MAELMHQGDNGKSMEVKTEDFETKSSSSDEDENYSSDPMDSDSDFFASSREFNDSDAELSEFSDSWEESSSEGEEDVRYMYSWGGRCERKWRLQCSCVFYTIGHFLCRRSELHSKTLPRLGPDNYRKYSKLVSKYCCVGGIISISLFIILFLSSLIVFKSTDSIYIGVGSMLLMQIMLSIFLYIQVNNVENGNYEGQGKSCLRWRMGFCAILWGLLVIPSTACFISIDFKKTWTLYFDLVPSLVLPVVVLVGLHSETLIARMVSNHYTKRKQHVALRGGFFAWYSFFGVFPLFFMFNYLEDTISNRYSRTIALLSAVVTILSSMCAYPVYTVLKSSQKRYRNTLKIHVFFVFFPSACLSLTSKFTRMLSQSNWSVLTEYEETFLMFFVVYAFLQVFYVCIATKLGKVLAVDPALRKTVRGLYLVFLQVPVSSLLLIAADIAHRLYTVQIAMALVTFGTLSLLWLLSLQLKLYKIKMEFMGHDGSAYKQKTGVIFAWKDTLVFFLTVAMPLVLTWAARNIEQITALIIAPLLYFILIGNAFVFNYYLKILPSLQPHRAISDSLAKAESQYRMIDEKFKDIKKLDYVVSAYRTALGSLLEHIFSCSDSLADDMILYKEGFLKESITMQNAANEIGNNQTALIKFISEDEVLQLKAQETWGLVENAVELSTLDAAEKIAQSLDRNDLHRLALKTKFSSRIEKVLKRQRDAIFLFVKAHAKHALYVFYAQLCTMMTGTLSTFYIHINKEISLQFTNINELQNSWSRIKRALMKWNVSRSRVFTNSINKVFQIVGEARKITSTLNSTKLQLNKIYRDACVKNGIVSNNNDIFATETEKYDAMKKTSIVPDKSLNQGPFQGHESQELLYMEGLEQESREAFNFLVESFDSIFTTQSIGSVSLNLSLSQLTLVSSQNKINKAFIGSCNVVDKVFDLKGQQTSDTYNASIQHLTAATKFKIFQILDEMNNWKKSKKKLELLHKTLSKALIELNALEICEKNMESKVTCQDNTLPITLGSRLEMSLRLLQSVKHASTAAHYLELQSLLQTAKNPNIDGAIGKAKFISTLKTEMKEEIELNRQHEINLYRSTKVERKACQVILDQELEQMKSHVHTLKTAYNLEFRSGFTLAKLLVSFVRRHENEFFSLNGKMIYIFSFSFFIFCPFVLLVCSIFIPSIASVTVLKVTLTRFLIETFSISFLLLFYTSYCIEVFKAAKYLDKIWSLLGASVAFSFMLGLYRWSRSHTDNQGLAHYSTDFLSIYFPASVPFVLCCGVLKVNNELKYLFFVTAGLVFELAQINLGENDLGALVLITALIISVMIISGSQASLDTLILGIRESFFLFLLPLSTEYFIFSSLGIAEYMIIGASVQVMIYLHIHRRGKSLKEYLQTPKNATWSIHVVGTIVAIVTLFMSAKFSLASYRLGCVIIVLGLSGVYSFFFALKRNYTNRRVYYGVGIFCGCSFLSGIMCWVITSSLSSYYNDNLFFLTVGLTVLFPGMALALLVWWNIEDILTRSRQGVSLISMFQFFCCTLFMVPFGVVLPFFASLDIYYDPRFSHAFLTVIVVLSLVYVTDITLVAVFANKQIKNMEKEKFLKKVSKRIISSLKQINLKCNEVLARVLAEQLYGISDSDLLPKLTDCPLFVVYDNGRSVILHDTESLKKSSLCSLCREKNIFSKKLPFKKYCKPCLIEKIFNDRIENVNRSEEKLYANAERLALLKLKEIHHKEEQQRKRKEETKQYLTAMNLMRRKKVSYPTPSKFASFLIQTNKINF